MVDFDGLCSADMYPIEAKENTKYLLYYMSVSYTHLDVYKRQASIYAASRFLCLQNACSFLI